MDFSILRKRAAQSIRPRGDLASKAGRLHIVSLYQLVFMPSADLNGLLTKVDANHSNIAYVWGSMHEFGLEAGAPHLFGGLSVMWVFILFRGKGSFHT